MTLYDEVINTIKSSKKRKIDIAITITDEHKKIMDEVISIATDPLHREHILEAASKEQCEYKLYTDFHHLIKLSCLNDETFDKCIHEIKNKIHSYYPKFLIHCDYNRYHGYELVIRLDWYGHSNKHH